MRNVFLQLVLLTMIGMAGSGILIVPNASAVPPVCDPDKPNQYSPECICPIGALAFAGRLPIEDLAQNSAVSVYPQGGAEYVICLPPLLPPPPLTGWNGSMVYGSMGTVRLDPNEKEGTIVTVAGQLFIEDGMSEVPLAGLFNGLGYGFAVAAPPQLLSVPSREADLELLVEVVEQTLYELGLGQPMFSYVVGFSQGAIPAVRLLENRAFSGGASVCGPIGSFGSIPGGMQPAEPPLFFTQIEYSLQFLVIVDYFFPELKLLRDIPPPFVNVPRVPVNTLATWDEDEVEAVFGDLFNADKVIQVLNEMTDLGLPVAIDPTDQVPVKKTLAELLEEVTFFVNDAVSDLGGSIFDNEDTEYFDFALNAGVRRYRSTIAPGDVEPYETMGLELDDPPLVALHNVLDHRVSFTHVPLYAMKRDPLSFFPVPIDHYGHCEFTLDEAVLAFLLLVNVVESE